uniref:Ig-like domain-containing protein n=1 Tax=Oncorhynchus tshawytscha TaxID=74940 RepID=A0AAZ3SIG0_ONCTS
WTAEVPDSVSGLEGSCIVIPCSFNYPEPKIKPSEFTGIWFKDTSEVIYHPDSSNVITDYRGRTELVGNLRQKNCSLRIDPLHSSDKGPFTFRIEIKDYNKASYKYDRVSIAVRDSPDPLSLSVMEVVKVGEEVSASCSVSHSCPSDPPLITWSHSGTPSIQSQQQTKGQWEETSTLTFRSSNADNNQPLVCTAAYRGGKRVKSSKTLTVKCKWPKYLIHPHVVTKGHVMSVYIILRQYSFGCSTTCSVKIKLFIILIPDPPEIKVDSACTSDISMVTCLCIVDSEPPSTVEWSLPAGHLPSTRVEMHGSVTMVSLQRALGFSETVHCHASNTQGNATLSFTVSTNGKGNSWGSVSLMN